MAENEATQSASQPERLSNTKLYMLAFATAIVIANAYYIHPIIALVAEDFGISASMIGLAPAANQVALALGIILLLPLGDRINNRRLVSIFTIGQFLAIFAMALAKDFRLFVVASSILGFMTIAPYLLPAYVSKRVDPAQLGRATAMLTVGVIAGILVSRAGAGIIGEHFGWRAVYYVASSLMLAVSIAIPFIMEPRESGHDDSQKQSYFALIGSLGPITRAHPEIILSGIIQATGFGIFLSVWLGLSLHLTSHEMGYGADVVGYLALLAIVNLTTTPSLGRLADRVGARPMRARLAMIHFVAVLCLPFAGQSIWLLIPPLIAMNIVGPVMDISSRMIFLGEKPEIRTRLMTVYIALMFFGGGLASWAGTTAYEWGGWEANAWFAVCCSISIVALSAWALRWQKSG